MIHDDAPLTALLVARNSGTAATLHALLGDGDVVLKVAPPDRALYALTSPPPQVILLEIGAGAPLPVDLLGALALAAPQVPLVALVVDDQDPQIIAALAAGAHDYITTSAGPAAFVRRLRAALARPTAAHAPALADLGRLIADEREAVLLIDRDGVVRAANTAAATMLGHRADELLGLPFGTPIVGQLTATIDIPRVGEPPLTAELYLLRLLGDDRDDAYLTVLRRSHSQPQVDVDRRLMLAAITSTSDAIVITDLDGLPCYQNPAFDRLAGYSLDELRAAGGLLRLYRDVGTARGALAAARTGTPYQGEMRIVNRGGQAVTVLLNIDAVRDELGQTMALVAVHTDITERKLSEDRLAYMASHDALTGLGNRALLIQHLHHAIERRRRRSGPTFAVLLLDLDRFKQINDSLGHTIGDEVLVALAGRLKHTTRPGDTVARLGGDEFAIVLDTLTSPDDAWRIAARVQHTLSQPLNVQGHTLVIGASIGIAFGDSHATDPVALLRDADTALYQAKARGRARAVVFEDAMHAAAAAQLQLEIELRQALQLGALVMHYQPIVDLRSRAVQGLEALLRWDNPSRGLMAPDSFLHVAEESGLIPAIGVWGIAEVCRQARHWRGLLPDATLWSISVNLHSRHLDQPELPAVVEDALSQAGIPGSALTIEVTEHAALSDLDFLVAQLQRLKNLGVRVVLDDFGTGYSSLSHLARLPVDGVKIDRAFVQAMTSDPHAATIVRAVITLARELHLDVVAEGVETEEQRQALEALGCIGGQGWLFGRPTAPNAIARLLDIAWDLPPRAAISDE